MQRLSQATHQAVHGTVAPVGTSGITGLGDPSGGESIWRLGAQKLGGQQLSKEARAARS
jgi:hypothetical protein